MVEYGVGLENLCNYNVLISFHEARFDFLFDFVFQVFFVVHMVD